MTKEKKQQLLNFCALAGEVMVLLGAVVWMFWRSRSIAGDVLMEWLKANGAGVLFAAGAIIMSIGRLLGEKGDIAMMGDVQADIRVRRLHRQRVIAMVMLMLAAVLVNMRAGFYAFDVYVRPSLWLLPFLFFVVIETYTVFRLSSLEKKSEE